MIIGAWARRLKKEVFMSDIKKMYRTIMADHFPDELVIRFGDQTLVYRKRTWKIPDTKTGELIDF